MSGNPGGLIRWPAKLMLPLGFALVALQGVAEIIKRIAYLRGEFDMDVQYRMSAARRQASSRRRAQPRLPMNWLNIMPELMFGGPDRVHADRLSGRVLARGTRPAVRVRRRLDRAFFTPDFLQALPLRVFGILSNDLLLAIPFFTFMGAILERCGLAEDLLEGTGQLFGAVPGGLAYAVIFVGAILGAITGTVAASVIAMGMISLPIMLRYGYNPRVATGVIAASGTITQLIPPSLVLVVLADQIGKPVGDMYAGAIGPSIVQVAALHPVHAARLDRPAAARAADPRRPAASRSDGR